MSSESSLTAATQAPGPCDTFIATTEDERKQQKHRGEEPCTPRRCLLSLLVHASLRPAPVICPASWAGYCSDYNGAIVIDKATVVRCAACCRATDGCRLPL